MKLPAAAIPVLLAAAMTLLPLRPALAQQSAEQRPAASEQSKKYSDQCWREGVRCSIVYGDKLNNEPSRPARTMQPREMPEVSGPTAVIAVLVVLIALLGLWMRFGAGGVLLASQPRNIKQRVGEAPQNWTSPVADTPQSSEQFLQSIAAMTDRRQAMIALLRFCLLHAADVTGTRLFRSDTERTIFSRLPANLTGRDQLRQLLVATELAHYGGRTTDEEQFTDLFATARQLLRGAA